MRRRLAALRRHVGGLTHGVATLWQHRPTIEPQSEAADCGYVCISALMCLLERPMRVQEIKERVGTTARGLTLRQLRDGLRNCGVEADVISFDRARAASLPAMGAVLLSSGHYVVISRHRGDRVEIYDPQIGWAWLSRHKLARRCGGLAVEVRGHARKHDPIGSSKEQTGSLPLRRLLAGRTGRRAVATFALAQAVALALPLLSMWSVDRSVSGLSLTMLSTVAIGFAALSLTNIFITLFGELVHGRLKRHAAVSLSGLMFDSLAEKPAYWFDLNNSASLQNRAGSLQAQLDFHIDAMRALGSLAITFLVGLAALLFISPWLIIPSLCALLLSIGLDLLFERAQRNQFATMLESVQRRQGFVLDNLSQLPLIARFGALAPARARFKSLVRQAAASEASLQSLRGWRSALDSLAKSGETLFFVTLAAAFMTSGNFTIGGFVALGAYKDLLASAINMAFQLVLRRRTLEVHKLQAAPLLTYDEKARPTGRAIQRGDIQFRGLSFAYGSLERPVLSQVDFHVRAGECVVVRGPSGAGKSTLARLLVGSLQPTQGLIEVDGLAPAEVAEGIAAVLQSDRLITGTIRENVVLFRRNINDMAVAEALKLAAIDDFVCSLPMGMSTRVGEGVGGLSGGQRQRLLIARALIGEPRLLILDEATSSLEVEVEGAILEALGQVAVTTILIAHRPEVWKRADRIFTIDRGGKLLEEHLSLLRQRKCTSG